MNSEVVVVDHDDKVRPRFEPLDVQFLVGTGTSADVLEQAGVDRADVIVACTGLDEVNIVCCAVARQHGRPRTYCVVSREDFLELQGQRDLIIGFGIDRLVWPEGQLAADIERIVVEPEHSMQRRLPEAPSNSSSIDWMRSRCCCVAALPSSISRTIP